MSRYIDADALIKQLKSSSAYNDYEWSMYADGFIEDIDTAPSIDIVRCKECKYEKRCTTNVHFIADNGLDVIPVHFCSYGERREP